VRKLAGSCAAAAASPVRARARVLVRFRGLFLPLRMEVLAGRWRFQSLKPHKIVISAHFRAPVGAASILPLSAAGLARVEKCCF